MTKEQLFKKFAKYYDKIYADKNYKEEVKFIKWAIKKYKKSMDKKLLDVACGTGNHAILLKGNYSVLGIDISNEMLKIAQKKVKGVKFVIGDMKKLNLKQKFDVIICMFSSINYNTNYEELEKTLRNFYKHLQKGGIVIFDVGFNKESWKEGYIIIKTVVDKNLKIVRISQSRSKNSIFNLNFIFLIKEKGKFDFDIDQHKLGIFETNKVRKLMNKIGFKTFIYTDYTNKIWNKKLKKRPVFVGVK